MGFVLNARSIHGRTTAFGLPKANKEVLTENISRVLQQHNVACAMRSPQRLKSLRSKLINAMSCDVVYQPSAGLYDKVDKTKFCLNPVWVVAPKGAFYKAKKLCSLATDVVLFGFNPKIVPLLVRLSTYMWEMSKRHFSGLCRKIRAVMARSDLVRTASSPEATVRLSALTVNPGFTRELWSSRDQENFREIGKESRLRASTCVELNAYALWQSHLRLRRR